MKHRTHSPLEEITADPVSTQIIKLLEKNPDGLHFSNIVRKLRKPKETINKRLKRLCSRGIVVKEKRGKYMIYRLSDLYEDIKSFDKIRMSKFILFVDLMDLFTEAIIWGNLDLAKKLYDKIQKLWFSFLFEDLKLLVNDISKSIAELREKGVEEKSILNYIIWRYKFYHSAALHYLTGMLESTFLRIILSLQYDQLIPEKINKLTKTINEEEIIEKILRDFKKYVKWESTITKRIEKALTLAREKGVEGLIKAYKDDIEYFERSERELLHRFYNSLYSHTS